MMKNWKMAAASLLACSMMLTGAAAVSANETEGADFSAVETVSEGKLIVGTEAGFAPYEYLVGDQVEGVDMDIAKAIADAVRAYRDDWARRDMYFAEARAFFEKHLSMRVIKEQLRAIGKDVVGL